MMNPELLQSEAIVNLYPPDVIRRARRYVELIAGGIGSYTHSAGMPWVRESVAKFIERRDQCGSVNPDHIYLTNGGSHGVDAFFTMMISGYKDGVLIPVPVYPLYSALIDLQGATGLGYELASENGKWVVDLNDIQRKVEEARSKGISPRCLVAINPGNPTGQVLNYDNMRAIVDYCYDEGIIIIADEVYQDNIYEEGAKFNSFRKVALEAKKDLEIISVHSLSKGYHGECGIRAGYIELTNVQAQVQEQLLKLLSISLCSNSIGQVAVELMVNPPGPSEESYPQYMKEKTAILESLKRKAKIVQDGLNSMRNIRTNQVEGAMYAFPEIVFSQAAQKAAASAKMPVDLFYSLQLLEKTGIMVVPGSGFGQHEGTWHFRTTILPSEEAMSSVIEKFSEFNEDFHQRYSD